MVYRTQQKYGQAYQLSQGQHLVGLDPVEHQKADVEAEGVERQDEAIYAGVPLVEGNYHSEEGVEENSDQEEEGV